MIAEHAAVVVPAVWMRDTAQSALVPFVFDDLSVLQTRADASPHFFWFAVVESSAQPVLGGILVSKTEVY